MIQYLHTRDQQSRPVRRPRHDETALLQLASRLTARDRHLLGLLADHHVFTTPQIAQLAYGSYSRARAGMLRLANIGAVERFRPLLPPGAGSAPLHYILGEAGARVIAAERTIAFTEFGYRRDRLLSWAFSPQLGHLIGINGLLAALTYTARNTPGVRLAHFWPEQRCAQTWGTYTRPDAYGRWCEQDSHVDFFLEYDTGTETLAKVARKLRGYAQLSTADGVTTPVLIYTSTPKRETNLRRHLANPPVPVATATHEAIRDHRQGPAGPIWLPVDERPDTPRRRLIALADRTHTDQAARSASAQH